MKLFVALLTSSISAFVAAQDLSSLPACGQLCIGNMFAKAESLGCETGNYTCLCNNVNFGYGIRDCSKAVCTVANAADTIAFGASLCEQYTSSTSGAVGVLASVVSSVSDAIASASSAGAAAASSVPVSTVPLAATINFGGGEGSVILTTGSSTVYSAVNTTAGVASPTESSGVSVLPLLATITTDGSTITTTTGSTTVSGFQMSGSAVSSGASSTASSASSGASSSSSHISSTSRSSSRSLASGSVMVTANYAHPVQTAGPMLGAMALAMLALV